MVPETETPAAEIHESSKKKKKKKDKVRSAWISFAGRIVAQMVGAMATVGLGVTVLHQYKGADVRQPRPASVSRSAAATPRQTPIRPGEIAVAVLPLENFSADAGRDYLADGMTEILITDLAKVDGLRVVSRTSSMQFKGQRQPLRDIAVQLGAQWIVEGSVAMDGTRLRITAQLIDAATDHHAWADSYDRSLADPLAMQAEVADTIAKAVKAALPSRPLTAWNVSPAPITAQSALNSPLAGKSALMK
jgi:TolB-like protein